MEGNHSGSDVAMGIVPPLAPGVRRFVALFLQIPFLYRRAQG